MALETEIELYNEMLPELLASSSGKIAVIKGRDFLGAFDDWDAAYGALLPKYGFVQCLMRKILPSRPVYDMRNLHFGVIRVQR